MHHPYSKGQKHNTAFSIGKGCIEECMAEEGGGKGAAIQSGHLLCLACDFDATFHCIRSSDNHHRIKLSMESHATGLAQVPLYASAN